MLDISQIKETILKLKKQIILVQKENTSLSEIDTRQGLINPLFKALGWDFTDFRFIKSEVRHKDYNEPVDYAFYSSQSSETPVLLVEAKALGIKLKSKAVKQLCSYLGEMGVQWGVLSDGNKYVMYNSRGGDSYEDQRFMTLELKTIDTEDGLTLDDITEKFVALFSKECLEDDKIQNTYEEHMINSQIDTAIQSLFAEPFETLVTAIRKEFKKERVKDNSQFKIRTCRIIEYLKNISDEEGKIQMNMDSVSQFQNDEVIQAIVASKEESKKTKGKSQNTKETLVLKHQKRITMLDLLKEGIICEGDNWKFPYKGEMIWGQITGNGELEVNSKICSSPSKAGYFVTTRPCSGWQHWLYKNSDEQWNSIDGLRKIYNEKTEGSSFKKQCA